MSGTLGDGGTPIWIIGTGGHARVARDLAVACGGRVRGFLDPAGERAGSGTDDFQTELLGLPVRRGYNGLGSGDLYAVGIGDNSRRRESDTEASRTGAQAATLIHPTACVEPSGSIGQGAQVCIGAIVCSGATLGRGALINSGAIVEHGCDIGDYAHICPGAALAGDVTVGAGAMVGLGARVIQGVTIGEGAIVGAGAVVLRDVAPGAKVVGVPAQVI